MATITGTSGNDTINGGGVSAGVTGGVPTSGFDLLMGSLGNDSLDGVGFWNRLDYSNLLAANAVTVTITNSTASTPVQGSAAKAGGGGTDSFVNVNEIYGTAGGDSFTGYAQQNYVTLYFNGRGGNDTINGGSTTNSWTGADYFGAPTGAVVNLGTGTASDGWGGTDTLINILRVRGTAFSDSITGGAGFDYFVPTAGNDTYDGAGNRNDLTYMPGDAQLDAATSIVVTFTGSGAGTVLKSGGQGTDSFSNVRSIQGTDAADSFTAAGPAAGQATTFMYGHGGNDSFNGAGNGAFVVSYNTWGVTAGVNANLGTGSGSDGQGGTDSYSNVRGLQGSSFNDTLVGSAGNDTMLGSGGSDSYSGNGGTDTLDYSQTSVGVLTMVFTAGTATVTKGNGGTDTVGGFASFVGSTGNDTFRPSTVGVTIAGGGGSSDVLDYRSAAGLLNVNVGFSGYFQGSVTKALSPSGLASDSFSGVRSVYATANDDTLAGAVSGGSLNFGGSGNKLGMVLRGEAGADFIDGRLNTANVASYGDSPNGVFIRLQTSKDGDGNVFGTASDGWQVTAAPTGTYYTDTLKNVLSVVTSAFNDTVLGSDYADYFNASTGTDSFDGGLGYNTVDYNALSSVSFSFGAPGAGLFGMGNATATKNGGAGGTDTLLNVNEVYATSGNDVESGTSAAYTWMSLNFRASPGNDTINGYANAANRIDYAYSSQAVLVDLAAGTASDGQGGTDTLINVRSVRGSMFNDTILGSAGNDYIYTNSSGSHTLDSRGGVNRVQYTGTDDVRIELGSGGVAPGGYGGFLGTLTRSGGGTDSLANFTQAVGGAGNDTIIGTSSDDFLGGGPGNNLLDGLGGSDIANYRSWSPGSATPSHGAVIDLQAGTATNPWDGTDTLVNIQSATGSQFADTIIGAVTADDRFSFLRGDGGNDRLVAASHNTQIVADYNGALTGVSVDLGAGVASDDGWFGGTDTLVNIQAARGSANNDQLAGSGWSDTLFGSGGSDTLDGRGGIDIAKYAFAKAGATLTHNADGSWSVVKSAGGTDLLRSIEAAEFTDGVVMLKQPTAADLNADSRSDVLLQDANSGAVYLWQMNGLGMNNAGFYGWTPGPQWRGAATGDFNGDGRGDVLLQNTATGDCYAWVTDAGGSGLAGVRNSASGFVGWTPGTDWRAIGTGLFNPDDQFSDILLQNQQSGACYIWSLNGTANGAGSVVPGASGYVGWTPGADWKAVGIGDFNGDTHSDILLQNQQNGACYLWALDGTANGAASVVAGASGFVGWTPGADWKVRDTGDYNGDGRSDILLQNAATGDCYLWMVDGKTLVGTGFVGWRPGADWVAQHGGDFNNDGNSDILLQNSVTGADYVWEVSGTTLVASGFIGWAPGGNWHNIG